MWKCVSVAPAGGMRRGALGDGEAPETGDLDRLARLQVLADGTDDRVEGLGGLAAGQPIDRVHKVLNNLRFASGHSLSSLDGVGDATAPT